MIKPPISGATRATSSAIAAAALSVSALCVCHAAAAQNQPAQRAVTAAQQATARQTAAAGVPLSALAPDAPQRYTVQRGDTLWHIAGLYLRSPWRWPELWGMNLQDIRNPHLIYPGQELYLDRTGGRAILRARQVVDGEDGPTVRVSPRNRVEALDANPLPTLEPGLIEPFLTESLIVDDGAFKQAPRIVAVQGTDPDRMIAGMGDLAYVLGPQDKPVVLVPGRPTDYQVFRETTPLKDPVSGDVLGYEAQYVGRATLVHSQSDTAHSNVGQQDQDQTLQTTPPESGNIIRDPDNAKKAHRALPIPATFRIDSSHEEMRPGDRLLPTPQHGWRSYTPHAPDAPVDARVVKVFGDESVRYAGQNQIVVINKGLRDGIETGHVLMVLTAGRRIQDATNGNAAVRLPDERNGLAMVFRPFERASYALIMNITQPVQAGDRLVNPR
ncbi:MAG: LysM peptidoglycan-binding domain-containing protein [Burkholderiaceae bacterium]|jgi:hypothetical protein|nr:LysM peptidoglycan-binding domain-containing protein [Burkholderiaceae bacterium]